jgi:hypothetical protein
MMAKSTIRRVGSLFFLGIFLWFSGVKDYHDVIHGDDPHCYVKNAKHFHAQEHHCPICDFVLPYFDNQPRIELPLYQNYTSATYLIIEQSIALHSIPSLPSRGPPVLG